MPWELPGETLGPKRRPGEKKTSQKELFPLPRGAHFDTFSALLFVLSLRDTKKGGPGGPPKLEPFFSPFEGLPGGPQEGSLLHDSSILTFAPGHQKDSQMETKMERSGIQKLNYTHFGVTCAAK